MKTKKERNSLKEDKIQEQKFQEVNDDELEKVNGGMKIVIDDAPHFLRTILRFIFG